MAVLRDALGEVLLDAIGSELIDADGIGGGSIIAHGGIAISRKRWKQLRKELKKERKEAASSSPVVQEVEPAAPVVAISPAGILGPGNRAASRPSVVAAGSADTQDALAQAEAYLAHMRAYIAHQEALDEEEALFVLLAA